MTSIQKVSRLSDTEIQEAFQQCFDEQVSRFNGMSQTDFKCDRDLNTVVITVTVMGYAGSPTLDDFKSGNVENSQSIIVNSEKIDNIRFDMSEVVYMNSVEYCVVYKMV